MKIIPAITVVLILSTCTFAVEPNEPDLGAKRAATLKADVDHFQLGLSYVGASDKPYYSLLLSVPKVNVKQADAFFLTAQLTEDQALKIISHLAKTGVLDQAARSGEPPDARQPYYRLNVIAEDLKISTSLGWGPEMLKRLDDLRTAVDGAAAEKTALLLGRLAGHRRAWEAVEK